MNVPSETVRHLLSEHHTLASSLAAFEHLLDEVEEGKKPDRALLRVMVDCISDFCSLRHEEKEEALLVPELERLGMEWDTGPLAYTRREHRQVHYLIRSLQHDCHQRDDWDGEDRRHFVSIGRELISFLTHHMKHEEKYLFPEAEARLTPEIDAELAARFEEIDQELDHDADNQSLQARAALLVARFGGGHSGDNPSVSRRGDGR